MVLRDGVKWGIAIGCAWGLVAIVPINIFAPKMNWERRSGSLACSPGFFFHLRPALPARLRPGAFESECVLVSGAELSAA